MAYLQLLMALGLLYQPADRHSGRGINECISRRPTLLKRSSAANIDYIGLGFLRLSLASLQIMLDKGPGTRLV